MIKRISSAIARLRRKDREQLKASSIRPDVIKALGYRCVTRKAELTTLGFSQRQRAIAAHDEVVVECDEGDAEGVAAWLQQGMIDGIKALIRPVPVAVEVKIGRTWAGEQPEADHPGADDGAP